MAFYDPCGRMPYPPRASTNPTCVRRLIVGRPELGYNYRQLAFTERLPSAEAARKAMQRALARLLEAMPDR